MIRILSVIIVAILPVAIALLLSGSLHEGYYSGERAAPRAGAAERDSQHLVKAAQLILDRELAVVRARLQAVSALVWHESLSAKNCEGLFKSLHARDAGLASLTMSGAEGEALCKVAEGRAVLTPAAAKAIKESFIHNDLALAATEEGMAAAWSLTSWDGRRLGALSMDLDRDRLVKQLRAVVSADIARLAVTADDGTVLLVFPAELNRIGAALPSGWSSEQDGRLLSIPGETASATVHLLVKEDGRGVPGMMADEGAEVLLAAILAGTLVAALVGWHLFAGQRTAAPRSDREAIGGAGGGAGADETGQRNEHWQDLADAMPCAVFVIASDGTIQVSNSAAGTVAGMGREQLAGCSLLEGLADRLDASGLNRLENAMMLAAAGQSSSLDVSVRQDGGNCAVFELTVSPISKRQHRVDQLMITAIDITRQARNAVALRATEERFQSACRAAGIIIFYQDRELRYSWMDRKSLEPAHDLITDQPGTELFGRPEDIAYLTELKSRVIRQGVALREMVQLHHAGRDLFFDITLAPLRDDMGNITGLSGAAVDITDRKKTEMALELAKQVAEEAVQSKSRFLAAASHDLRQPVQSLYLFTAALGNRLIDHPGAPLLANIQHSLDTLKSLLDSLLDIARLEEGKTAASLVDLPLGPVLARIASEYGPRATEKGLRLRVVPSSLVVRSDPVHLDRILRNLLENALRYTPAGDVVVGVHRGAGGPGRVRLCVLDTGIGIPADRLGDIFEEFSQINGAERGQGHVQGLGLGLTIVKRLTDLLDYGLSVSSAVGRGSCFAITMALATSGQDQPLPARPDGLADRPDSPPADNLAEGSREDRLVLVVDSESVILTGLKAMLEGWGCEVLAAVTASEALAGLADRGRIPHFVLADYQLQDGSTGAEVLARVRDLAGWPVPGAVLTGDTGSDRLREAHAGGYTILHKPVHPVELHRLIRSQSGRGIREDKILQSSTVA